MYKLYFVFPREQPWRQAVFQTMKLIIVHVICVFSRTFKINLGIGAQRMHLRRCQDETKYIYFKDSTGPANNLPLSKATICDLSVSFCCSISDLLSSTERSLRWMVSRILLSRMVSFLRLLISSSFDWKKERKDNNTINFIGSFWQYQTIHKFCSHNTHLHELWCDCRRLYL